MLYVDIKLWYEIDDKVVFKEIKKKYGDIYLNKLFKVSINYLNKLLVILIYIIWFLEEVYKKKKCDVMYIGLWFFEGKEKLIDEFL